MSRARPPGPGRLAGLGNTLRLARDPLGFYEACAPSGDVARARVESEEVSVATRPTPVERVTFGPVDEGPPELAFGTTLRPTNGLSVVVRERAATPER
jgi:hypothetical protein